MALSTVKDCGPGLFIKREVVSFLGERKIGCCLAIGAVVVVVGTLEIVAYIKRKNRRKRWNNIEKDKVVLHMIQRGYFSPNISPFVLKLETYLRMAQIPYEIDFEEPWGPKGKFPWITLNGEEIADSQLILEKLGRLYKKDFSKHLSEEEKAVESAMRILVDEHFFWCFVIWRFITDDCRAFFECMKTPLYFKLVKYTIKARYKKMALTQGIGRHSDKDVEEFGRKALWTLSTWLGNKSYFMGETPTEVDCTVFGMLAQIEWNAARSPYLRMIKGDFKNLSAYCHRVKEKYWPDWNQCLETLQP